jgi:hypothetical protein
MCGGDIAKKTLREDEGLRQPPAAGNERPDADGAAGKD